MQKNNKKVKKGRGTVLSLNSFLGETPSGTVVKKISSMENEDGYEDGLTEQVMLQLPTAPKANRLLEDDSIPHKPPFIARLSNLPFDADEEDIREFFGDFPIVSLRLPREDGETGRVRGFGNIEFENREAFISALSMPDPNLKGRRIRIEQFNENENQNSSQRTNKRGGFSNFTESGTDRESTNWRRDPAGSGAASYDAASTRYSGHSSAQRESSAWRQNLGTSRDEDTHSSWRNEDRPSSGDFSSWRIRTDDERHCDNFASQRNFERSNNAPMNDRRNYSQGRSSSWRNKNEYEGTAANAYDSNEQQSKQRPIEQRPRLELKPRTLPLPEIIVQDNSSATTEEKQAAALPGGSAQLETISYANAGVPVRLMDEPEIVRIEHRAKVEIAAQPTNEDESQLFADILNINDETEGLPDSTEDKNQSQSNQHNARNESINLRRLNESIVSPEADSGHDSDGAVGYDYHD